MADPKEHVLDVQLGRHISTGSGEDGACLVGCHISEYKESDSCSHRWQAYRKAQDNPTMYNYPKYKELCDLKLEEKKQLRTARAGQKMGALEILPDQGAWDLGASNGYWRSLTVEENGVKTKQPTHRVVQNFTVSSDIPYWHQAHHIIPTSVLKNCLWEAAENDIRLFLLVRIGLLEAKYNFNHKVNLIILPMGKVVAAVLRLPRHIAGVEARAEGVKFEQANHPVYNRKVKAQVEKVISQYARQIAQEEHDQTIPAFTRAQLERISSKLFLRMKNWGAAQRAGKALDQMPDTWYLFLR